jgi:ABC-2 type transport system permease protein
MQQSLHTIKTFALVGIKRSFRDKVALFFIFVFPIIFLFIFGGIFGKSNNVSFNIALINQSNTQFSKDFADQIKKDNKTFKIKDGLTDETAARKVMKRGEIDAIIKLPQDFGQNKDGQQYPSGQAEVLYDQNNQQSGQTLSAVLDGIFKQVNQQVTGIAPAFTVKSSSTKEQGLTPFDFVFSGLLGFSLLSLGIFGPTQVFPRLKTQGVLRRYRTTTIAVWEYFIANVLSQMTIGLLSAVSMLLVALTVFDLNMKGNYLTLAFVVMLGTTVMYGIGLAIGGWARNENQAAPLSNLISFPMMFLSGTFFPRYAMPEWLQHASSILPLTPIIDSIRKVTTEGATVFNLGPELALITGWGIIIYFIAFRVFRWE